MSDADLNPPTLTQEQEGSPSDGASSPEPTTTPEQVIEDLEKR